MFAVCFALGCLSSFASDYAVVIDARSAADPGWRAVAEVLEAKHGGTRVTYTGGVEQAGAELKRLRPRFACFVAPPDHVTTEFVVAVHGLTRALDDDPYTDTIWGILTGYDASNALRIARRREPLTVRRVLSGTAFALECVEEGVWYDELEQGKVVRKTKGGRPEESRHAADSTESLAKALNDDWTDLLITSGHATERDWQIGYRFRGGSFNSKAGVMTARDPAGRTWEVHSSNPKVYLPVGNCLMGHIDGPDAMALAWMNSAGVMQMIGYLKPTWFGYMGWGLLDYFLEQPGRFTLAEAFFANQQALIHALQKDPQSRGLQFDRDMVAFYGDPAWEARMAPGACRWEQSLTEKDGVFTFEMRPKAGADSFRAVNVNGSQRGSRPIIHLLPRRIGPATVIEGAELSPVITENFLLTPLPAGSELRPVYRVAFRAG